MNKYTLLTLSLSFLLSWSAFSQTYVTQVKPAGNKKWGYATLTGVIIQPQYEKCYEFSVFGLAPIYDSKQKQYYFINLKGERLDTEIKQFKLIEGFAFGFDLTGFVDGLIPVKQGDKWGFLNTEGKLAIPAKYDQVVDFNGGYTSAKIGDKFVVLDTKGNESPVDGSVIDVRKFSESLGQFRAADKKVGFIDASGKIVIPAKFESVGHFKEGLTWAKTDKTVGYINTKGEWVIKPQFEVGKDFDKESGLARIKMADKWGYVSKSGEVTYAKDTDIYEDFSNGLARGRKDGKFGFLDSKGEWAIKPEFDGSRDFKNGYAAVKKGETWGVIDKTGKWVIEPIYDGIRDMELVK